MTVTHASNGAMTCASVSDCNQSDCCEHVFAAMYDHEDAPWLVAHLLEARPVTRDMKIIVPMFRKTTAPVWMERGVANDNTLEDWAEIGLYRHEWDSIRGRSGVRVRTGEVWFPGDGRLEIRTRLVDWLIDSDIACEGCGASTASASARIKSELDDQFHHPANATEVNRAVAIWALETIQSTERNCKFCSQWVDFAADSLDL